MSYDLVERLGGLGDETLERIEPQAFIASLAELAQSQITKQAIIDHYSLDATAQNQLNWLIGRYNEQPNATAKASFIERLGYIFWMVRADFPGYQTTADLQVRISAI